MPSVVPPIENSTMRTAISTVPRPLMRVAIRATPLSMAPVFMAMVMKTPMAMTNRNTPAAPKSSPDS